MAVKRSAISVGLYLALVFTSGAVVGAFGHKLYSAKSVVAKNPSRPPEDFRQRYFRQMKTRLKLDDGQMQKLTLIFDEFGVRYKTTKDRIDPEMKQIQAEQRERVREILSETQKAEYAKMIEERDRQHRQHGH